MIQSSPWARRPHPRAETLPATADVVVVGGGITGLTTAVLAAEAGASVVLLDAADIGAGNSTALPGLLTLGQGTQPHDIRELHGDAAVARWAVEVTEAAQWVHHAAAAAGVPVTEPDVALTTTDGHWAFKLRWTLRALRVAGAEGEFTDHADLPFPVRPSLQVPGAVVDPGLWVTTLVERAVAARVVVAPRTPLVGLRSEGGVARVATPSGALRTRRVAVTTGAPVVDRTLARRRLRTDQWHLVAMPVDAPVRERVLIDVPETRLTHHRDHLVVAQRGSTADELLRWADRYWPGTPVTHRWTAETCASVDTLPLVGPADLRGDDTVLLATGLDADHLGQGTAAARQLTAAVLGTTPDWPWHPRRTPIVRGVSKRGRSLLAGAVPFTTRLNTPAARN